VDDGIERPIRSVRRAWCSRADSTAWAGERVIGALAIPRPVSVGTLGRYFAQRFLTTFLAVFFGIIMLVGLVDCIELMRHRGGSGAATMLTIATISFFRVPQLGDQIMPCAVLIAAMSTFLNLSSTGLVIARRQECRLNNSLPQYCSRPGWSALSQRDLQSGGGAPQEKSKHLEIETFGGAQSGLQSTGAGFWLRQRSDNDQSIINAITTSEQGVRLGGVTVFTFDQNGRFQERIEANTAALQPGFWELEDARIYASDVPPELHKSYALKTNLTAAQVRESFATPESVPFWDLPSYIDTAERAGVGATRYELQYQKLLTRPFLLAAMVLVAAASLRFFRFGGVQKCDSRWGCGRVSAVRPVESYRGSQQGAVDAGVGGGVDAGACRGIDGPYCIAPPGGRLMAAQTARPRVPIPWPSTARAGVLLALVGACALGVSSAAAQTAPSPYLDFRTQLRPTPTPKGPGLGSVANGVSKEQMRASDESTTLPPAVGRDRQRAYVLSGRNHRS
jgi:lipopolysaccharide export system permease protein